MPRPSLNANPGVWITQNMDNMDRIGDVTFKQFGKPELGRFMLDKAVLVVS